MKRQMKLHWLALLVVLVLSAVLPGTLQAEGEKWYGLIYNRPSCIEGTWIVGGRSFAVTSATWFDQDQGRLTEGACVSVEFVGNTATRIESESIRLCPRHGGSSFHRLSEHSEWHGIVTQRPAGRAGTWTVGELSFTATSGTWLDEDQGALQPGMCASVEFASNIALRIKSRAMHICVPDSDPCQPDHACDVSVCEGEDVCLLCNSERLVCTSCQDGLFTGSCEVAGVVAEPQGCQNPCAAGCGPCPLTPYIRP